MSSGLIDVIRKPAGGGGAPDAHAPSHESGGSDEIAVTGLLGVLGDTQKLSFQDEGAFVSERRTVNFTGAGVSVADDAGNSRVNVTISGGGGGSFALTNVAVDLGVGRRSGTFDITGLSGLTPGAPVLIVQSASPITSKGDARDEFELDPIAVTGYCVDANTIRAYWACGGGQSVAVGTYEFEYAPGS